VQIRCKRRIGRWVKRNRKERKEGKQGEKGKDITFTCRELSRVKIGLDNPQRRLMAQEARKHVLRVDDSEVIAWKFGGAIICRVPESSVSSKSEEHHTSQTYRSTLKNPSCALYESTKPVFQTCSGVQMVDILGPPRSGLLLLCVEGIDESAAMAAMREPNSPK